MKRSLKAGADLHVNKPVKKKTLAEAILKLTEGAKQSLPHPIVVS